MNFLIQPGDTCPIFCLQDSNLKYIDSKEIAVENAIIFFYPSAGTPGCTKEACDFRDNLSSFQKAGYKVIGISKDQPEKLRKFKEEQELTFDLLSDPELLVHKRFGAFGEKSLYGKKVTGVIRSTFVIDEAGKLSMPYITSRQRDMWLRLRKDLDLYRLNNNC